MFVLEDGGTKCVFDFSIHELDFCELRLMRKWLEILNGKLSDVAVAVPSLCAWYTRHEERRTAASTIQAVPSSPLRKQVHETSHHRDPGENGKCDFNPTVGPFALHFACSGVDVDLIGLVVKLIRQQPQRQ